MFDIKVNEEEQEAFNIWYAEHKSRCPVKKNKIILTITSTGIGQNFKAKCPFCKEEKDISDYNSW